MEFMQELRNYIFDTHADLQNVPQEDLVAVKDRLRYPQRKSYKDRSSDTIREFKVFETSRSIDLPLFM